MTDKIGDPFEQASQRGVIGVRKPITSAQASAPIQAQASKRMY
jgi:hypothetical protein